MCASRATKWAIGPPSAQTYTALGEEKVTNNTESRRWHHRRQRRHQYYKKGGADIGPTEPPRFGVNYTNVT